MFLCFRVVVLKATFAQLGVAESSPSLKFVDDSEKTGARCAACFLTTFSDILSATVFNRFILLFLSGIL